MLRCSGGRCDTLKRSPAMRVLVICHTLPNPWEPKRDRHVLRHLSSASERCEMRVVVPVMWPRFARNVAAAFKIDKTIFPFEYPVWWYPPKCGIGGHGSWMWGSIRSTIRRIVKHVQARPNLRTLDLSGWLGCSSTEIGNRFTARR